jgi:aromatic-L-amino-acid/L-tryptophan decarboxylase
MAEPAVAEYLNQLNEAVLARTQQEGRVYLSNAVLDERFLLRACVVNFRTTSAHVREVPEIVADAGRRVHAELWGSAGAPRKHRK